MEAAKRIIRTAKHVTITEAHPYHDYIVDERDHGGHALVQVGFDANCPKCRGEIVERQERYITLKLTGLEVERIIIALATECCAIGDPVYRRDHFHGLTTEQLQQRANASNELLVKLVQANK